MTVDNYYYIVVGNSHYYVKLLSKDNSKYTFKHSSGRTMIIYEINIRSWRAMNLSELLEFDRILYGDFSLGELL